MSKIFTVVLTLSFPFLLSAQIKKNSLSLGGQLSYSSVKYQVDNFDQKSENGAIGISLGKAFKENFVAGINVSYSPSKQSNLPLGIDTATHKYNTSQIGVFLRQYKKLAKDLYFFGEVNAAFITAEEKYDFAQSGDVKARQRGGVISLTPGISYQVFRRMQLELTIPNILAMKYSRTNLESQNSQIKNAKGEEILFYSNLNTNTNLGWLGVGFRFIF